MIYIGSVCNDEMITELKRINSHIDFPGITFQRALLKGLDHYYHDLNVISSPFISSYPKANKVFVSSGEFCRNTGHKGVSICTGLINIPVIKMFSKFYRVRKHLNKLLREDNDARVIIYALHSPFLLAAASLRSKLKKICVVIPDLPEYMTSKSNWLTRLGKSIDRKIIDFCLKKFDCFVLLSPYMSERLPIKDKKWIQIEGIFESGQTSITIEKDSQKSILYTGNLSYKYGIKELLDAFIMLKGSDYRLWIRGNGEALNAVKEYAKKDNRIVWFDRMSKEELTKLQKRATLLINPTFSTVESTRYFFPSKTMEYLASGTPVLMSKLPCLPDEYDKHVYFIKDQTVEGIKEAIEFVLSKSKEELSQKGRNASEFIYKEKDSIMQVKKLVELMEA